MSAEDVAEPRPVAWARLAAAVAELALVLAFFYPAVRAALARPASSAAPPVSAAPMTLLVAATPAGATVTVDGAVIGRSPAATHVSCRGRAALTVEVAAAGFVTYRAALPCTPGGDLDVAPALTRAPAR